MALIFIIDGDLGDHFPIMHNSHPADDIRNERGVLFPGFFGFIKVVRILHRRFHPHLTNT